ncbi:hypothetical protein DJ528_12095, partial [Sulfolobus sp. B5]
MEYKQRKRSSLEIILDILKSCEEGCGVTKIIYGAGINYSVAQKYIDELTKMDVLKVKINENKKYYELTEKGRLLKNHLDEFIKLK